MIAFRGMIKNVVANENGTLKLECLSSLYNELMKSVDSFSIDTLDSNFDTWEKVVIELLSVYTNIANYIIDIKDSNNDSLKSEFAFWNKMTILDILNDIINRTNSYLQLDEYETLVIRSYNRSILSDIMIERSINLADTTIRNDKTRKINSVGAYVRVETNNSYIVKKDQGLKHTGVGDTYFNYKACSFRIPHGIQYITGYSMFAIAKVVTAPNIQVKMLYNSANQGSISPNYSDAGSTLSNSIATFTNSQFDIYGKWASVTLSPTVNVAALWGKKVWFAIAKTGTLETFDYNIAEAQQGEYINLKTDGIFSTGSILNGTFAIKIHGDTNVIFSGSAADNKSIAESGLAHQNIVTKNARSDLACTQYAESVISIFKNGIFIGKATIPFCEIFSGNRIVVHDPKNNIFYETLFISSINIQNGIILIDVTESELEINEFSSDLNNEQTNSDTILLS